MGRRVDFSQLVAPGVQRLQPYVPGKPTVELEREFGISNAVKLASNENPLGPPQGSLDAIRDALDGVAEYPDGSSFALKRALASHLGVASECITIGNGSNELLSIIAETFLVPGNEAVHAEHAFVVYDMVIRATGATGRVAPCNDAGGSQPLGHSLAAMRSLVNDRTRLVFIANPNNPTGTWLPAEELRTFVADLPRHVLAIVDEAYIEYMPDDVRPDTLAWLDSCPNLIVCRTFSKMYALAGLRVGYTISHPDVAEALNRVRQPFNVNALGQVAALAALAAGDHVRQSREVNRRGLEQLRAGLTAFGWTVPPSAGNFVLADTGASAMPWYENLLRSGVIVRPVGNYGLPRHLRITVGLPEQNDSLLRALADLRQRGIAE